MGPCTPRIRVVFGRQNSVSQGSQSRTVPESRGEPADAADPGDLGQSGFVRFVFVVFVFTLLLQRNRPRNREIQNLNLPGHHGPPKQAFFGSQIE